MSTAPPTARRLTVRRRLTWILVATALGLVSAAGIWQAVSTSSGSGTNALVDTSHRPARDFSLPNISAPLRVLSLAQVEGRPIVLNFWASWCVPCRTEMPLLEGESTRWRGRIEFIGIDTNDTKGAAQAFLAKVHVTYPSAFDPNASLAQAYGLFGLPVTVFIAADGRVQGRHIGELNAETLRAALSQAFPNAHPPA